MKLEFVCNMNKLIYYIILFCVIISCVDDKTPGPIVNIDDAPNLSHKGFFVLNEGAFTLGNGSISFYDTAEKKMYNKVFEAINKRALGDVVQSMSFHKGLGFIVVNNSGTIEVVDSTTFSSIKTISKFTSPRYLVFHNNEMYVSDLYANEISIVDLASFEIDRTIEVEGWVEEILVVDARLFCSYLNDSMWKERI